MPRPAAANNAVALLKRQNENARFAFRRQSDDLHLDPTIIVRSQTTLTWGDGQQRVIKLVERTTDGMRGCLEDIGYTQDFPRSARAKRNGNHLDDDDQGEQEDPGNDGEDAAVFDEEERVAAGVIAGGAAAAGRARGRARTATVAANTAEKRKKAKTATGARAAIKATKTTTSRKTTSSSNGTAAPARRSARVSRGRADENVFQNAAEDKEDNGNDERRAERDATPQQQDTPARRRTRHSAPEEPAVPPVVKNEEDVQDLHAMLHNFDLASIADTESTQVYSRENSVASTVEPVASTSRM